jgi:hypothetical protein
MVCHGDRGQGLSEDYLNVLNPVDRNCWQSHCHAANHPQEGFTLPQYVPAIIGPGEIEPFRTALILHDYLQARMPWQAPGSLSEDEYWQLTAYLMRENGYDPGKQPLDSKQAAAIKFGARFAPTLIPSATLTPVSGLRFWLAIIGVLALAGCVILLARYRQMGKH